LAVTAVSKNSPQELYPDQWLPTYCTNSVPLLSSLVSKVPPSERLKGVLYATAFAGNDFISVDSPHSSLISAHSRPFWIKAGVGLYCTKQVPSVRVPHHPTPPTFFVTTKRQQSDDKNPSTLAPFPTPDVIIEILNELFHGRRVSGEPLMPNMDKRFRWYGTYCTACMHGAWINLSALSLGTVIVRRLLGGPAVRQAL
jgi:hypothetical protein